MICEKRPIFAVGKIETMKQTQCNHNVGLVMEGGGMRGLFTAGVLDVLMENGIEFPCATGVSAGACFGVNLKSRQIGRALRYNVRMAGDRRYMSLYSLVTTGDIAGAEFCYHTMPGEIDVFDVEEYGRNPMQFHVVCTDIDTGEAVYRNIDHIDYEALEWIRASASLPIVSRPVLLDGRRLLDGGVADAIPLRHMESIGHDRNLVIVTQPMGFRKPATRHAWAYRLLCRKYPTLANQLIHRPEMYNAQLEYVEQQARDKKILLIAPPEKLDIGRVEQNPKQLKIIYNLGRKICTEQLASIQAFLAK